MLLEVEPQPQVLVQQGREGRLFVASEPPVSHYVVYHHLYHCPYHFFELPQ